MRQTILMHQFPRSLFQLSLQIISLPRDGDVAIKLPSTSALPALVLASSLATLTAGIPMSTLLCPVLIVQDHRESEHRPRKAHSSVQGSHTFVFSGRRELVLLESHGSRNVDQLVAAEQEGLDICFSRHLSSSPSIDMEQTSTSDHMGIYGYILETIQSQLPAM